ncbi:hypothetical protein ACFLSA_04980 [Bacteroidota bacterium]
MKILIITVFLLILYNPVVSKDNRIDGIELKFNHGRIFAHSPKINPVIKNEPNSVQVNLLLPTLGYHKWPHLYRYPTFGVGFHFLDFGNQKVLGYALTLDGFMRVPIINSPNFKFFYRAETGSSYITRKYDSIQNPLNLAIGSSLNMFIYLGFESIIQYKRLGLVSAIGMNHYSIGSLTYPNLGINVPAYSFGINYLFRKEKPEILKFEFPELTNRHELWFFGATGRKRPVQTHGYYIIASISANYAYRLNQKRKFGFGFDQFYDESIDLFLTGGEKHRAKSEIYYRSAINVSHELLFGDLSLITQYARYIYKKTKKNSSTYYRIGFRYHFNNLFCILALKTHLIANADFVEWGVGYSLN